MNIYNSLFDLINNRHPTYAALVSAGRTIERLRKMFAPFFRLRLGLYPHMIRMKRACRTHAGGVVSHRTARRHIGRHFEHLAKLFVEECGCLVDRNARIPLAAARRSRPRNHPQRSGDKYLPLRPALLLQRRILGNDCVRHTHRCRCAANTPSGARAARHAPRAFTKFRQIGCQAFAATGFPLGCPVAREHYRTVYVMVYRAERHAPRIDGNCFE